MKNLLMMLFVLCSYLSAIDISQLPTNLSKHDEILITDKIFNSPIELLAPNMTFKKNTAGTENFGYNSKDFWIKLQLSNHSQEAHKTIFELGFTPMDYVDFYELDNDFKLLNHYESGDLRDIEKRVIKNKNHIFPLDFAPNETKTILLKVKNSGVVTADLKLFDRFDYFSNIYPKKEAFIISFLAVILFLTIYNAILFNSLKDISFVHYFIAMLNMFILQATLFGVAYEYTPFFGLWNLTALVNISAAIFTAFSVMFVNSFFELKKYSPKIYKFTTYMLIMVYAPMILLMLIPTTYQSVLPILPILGIFMLFYILFLAVIGWKKSPIRARYIVIGWGVSGSLIILYVLQMIGIIESKILSDITIRVGTLVEMVFFSFALGDKLKFLKDEISEIKIKALEYEKQMLLNSRLAIAGETVGNIAHQWRQPLNKLGSIIFKIRGSLYFKKELAKDELKENIQETEKVLNDMSKTIDLFLNFFTPSSSADEFFLISQCLNDSIKIIQDSLEASQITLDIDMQKDFSLHGSSIELAQVFLNIISNSKDIAISRNILNPKISIKCFLSENNIIIEINDNCGGIKIEPLHKIFEPYISTKENKNGTGLGLYIAKKIIIEKFEGDIVVASNADKTTFKIIVPNPPK